MTSFDSTRTGTTSGSDRPSSPTESFASGSSTCYSTASTSSTTSTATATTVGNRHQNHHYQQQQQQQQQQRLQQLKEEEEEDEDTDSVRRNPTTGRPLRNTTPYGRHSNDWLFGSVRVHESIARKVRKAVGGGTGQ